MKKTIFGLILSGVLLVPLVRANTTDIVYGDANGDGSVTVADATAVIDYIHGKSTPVNMAAADANTDGVVDIADVTIIIDIIHDKITKQDPGVTAPTPNTLTYSRSDQELVTAGSTTGGRLKYSLNGESWSTEIPQATAAGPYTVYYKVEGNALYNAVAAQDVSVTINKKPVTVSGITANDKPYDGTTDVTFNYGDVSFDGLIDGDALTVTATGAFSSAGIGEGKLVNINSLSLGGTSADNYQIASGSQTYTTADITSINITPIVSLEGWTYGSPNDPTVTGNTGGGTVTYYYKTGNGDWTTTKPTNAGTHQVKASIAANGNYAAAESDPIEFTISKATLTATADNKSRDYGVENPSLTVTVTGFVNGETAETAADYTAPTANTTATATSAPGTYDITVSGGTAKNYDFTYTKGTLTVGNATLSVTAEDYIGTYDGSAHGITVTCSGATIKYGESSGNYNLTASPTLTNVGTKTVYYQVTKDNYTTVTGSKTITISQKSLTITAKAQEITYGNSIASGTNQVTTDGLVSGDELSSITLQASRTDVGSGIITPSAAATTKGADNYNITYNTGTLTITEASMASDVIATAYSAAYDGAAHGITVTAPSGATVKYGTSAGNYTQTSSPTYTDYAANARTVYYQVTKDNYQTVTGSSTVTITKKSLTITAKAQEITYGNSIASGTNQVTTDGLVSGDELSSITLQASRTDVGSGTITPSAAATTKGADNYSITYNTGTLTITEASMASDVIATAYSAAYDGAAHGITVTAPSGATVKYGTSAGNYTQTSSPTYTDYAANARTVYYQVTKDNYQTVTGSSTVTITKKALTITAKAQTITYGNSISTGTDQVTTSGLVSGDELSSITLTASRTTAGTGTITPSAAATTKGADNYSITYNTGTLTINKANSSLTTNPKAVSGTLTYNNGTAQTLFNAGSGATGGTLKYKVTTSSSKPSSTSDFKTTIDQGTNAGTYYLWYFVEGDDNHNSTSVNTTGISKAIGQAAGTVSFSTTSPSKTWSSTTSSNTYTQAATVTGDATPTYSLSNNTCGATISGSTVTFTKGGSVTVTATVANTTNYSYATTTATYTLTVNKANGYITLNATSGSVNYGGTTTFSVSSNHGGTLSVTPTNNSNSYVNATISGTTVTLSGRAATSTAQTITVNCAATDCYKAASTTYSVSAVNKAAPSVTLPSINNSLTYNGNSQTNFLMGGSVTGGTISYRYKLSTASSYSSWSTSTPTPTNAGTYTIQYKVDGDANHTSIGESLLGNGTIQKFDPATMNNTWSSSATSVNYGSSFTRSYTIYGVNANTLPVTYSSSNTNVASVSSTGVVTGNRAGTATITASFEGDSNNLSYSSSYTVTVNRINCTVSLSTTSLSLNNSTRSGTITVTRTGDGTVSATSSNSNVASVSVSGTTVTVTAKKSGNATITIKVNQGTNHNAYTATDKTVSVTASGIAPATLDELKAWINEGNTAMTYRGYYVTSTGAISTSSTNAIGRIMYYSNSIVEENTNYKILVLAVDYVGSYKMCTDWHDFIDWNPYTSAYYQKDKLNGLNVTTEGAFSGSAAFEAAYTWNKGKPDNASKWFIPSCGQWSLMYSVSSDMSYNTSTCWSSTCVSQNSNVDSDFWIVYTESSNGYSLTFYDDEDNIESERYVRACFAY